VQPVPAWFVRHSRSSLFTKQQHVLCPISKYPNSEVASFIPFLMCLARFFLFLQDQVSALLIRQRSPLPVTQTDLASCQAFSGRQVHIPILATSTTPTHHC
jgi:hypothetical protein